MITRHKDGQGGLGIIVVQHKISRRNRQVANARRGTHVAKVDQAGNARHIGRTVHQDIVIIGVVVDGLFRQVGQSRFKRGEIGVDTLYHRSTRWVGDAAQLSGDPARAHQIPFEITGQLRVGKIFKRPGRARQHRADLPDQA